jgi:protein-disulfide isomerase
MIIAGVIAPVLLAGALIGASQLDAREEKPAVAPATTLLRGIPQQGTALGSPSAPVTLIEYADLQCPYCGEWARNVFPQLVREYVSSGKLRIVYRGLAFIGPDSYTALQTAVAAGQQDKLWDVVHLLFERQGDENMGWANEDLLRDVVRAAGIPSLSVPSSVDAAIRATARRAAVAGVDATPSFEIGLTGQRLHRLELTSLASEEFTPKIDALLSK